MKPAALAIEDLSVWINTGPGRHRVIENMSFSIRPGRSLGLAGESGCGKSLTALAVMGLLPSPGFTVSVSAIKLNGRDISVLDRSQRRLLLGREIAMVFQQPGTALDPVFTLGQQISRVFMRHQGTGKKQARQAMLASLGKAGFAQPEDIAAAYPHQLSGGMRQLAMIAMATVCKPAVVIADEPTTALDPGATALILQQLRRLRREHDCAVLLISHDLAVIRKNCQDALIMYCGRVLESSDTESLFSHPRHPYSAALLACIPRISHRRPAAIRAIPGQVPLMDDLPGGCHFAPRCERAEPSCRVTAPVLEPLHDGRVACFRPL